MDEMEIERKFLINKFPDLPLYEEYNVFQFYISTDPIEVRVRSKEKNNHINYKLTFKEKGKSNDCVVRWKRFCLSFSYFK